MCGALADNFTNGAEDPIEDASNHNHTDDAGDILTGDSTDIINLYFTVRCYARLDYIILYYITLCCALHHEY